MGANKKIMKISNRVNKLIIFDFDKTIVNLNVNWRAVRKKLRDFCLSHGLDIDFNFPHPIFESIKKARHIRQDLLDIVKNEEIKAVKKAKPIVGAKEFLEFINKKGIKFIIISNNHSQCIDAALKKFHFPEPEIIKGWDNVELLKPNPQALRRVLEKLKISPEHCLLIGDSNDDLILGKKLGIKTLLINNFNNFKQLKQIIV